jgi:2,4-dienoyl-CoA reductase-like NADH-dependent reductase (Old Yellow Enzyme family)/NADPH-dependent 2,4-dienoyl-CoA reductase/sulfur reductase-like enzyme
MASDFKHLLSPGRIGSMTLRNRIFMTAMGDNLAEADGMIGERTLAYYDARAKGGAALLTVGSVSVGYPVGSNCQAQVGLSGDRHVPGMRRLAETVHKHGARLALQLHFGGLVAMTDMKEGRPVWCPSIPKPPRPGDVIDGFLPDELANADFAKVTKVDFKVMTAQDAEHLIQMFADAAGRAKEAGCDGVELHGGHGYIFSSFLSPASNFRTDEYGGPLENRARLLLDAVRAVRSTVGQDFPIWCKIDETEFGKEDGITIEDAKGLAKMLQSAGVDAVTASSYADQSQGIYHSGSNIPDTPELMVPGAIAIKSVLDIPVITSGRIEPEAADKYIGAGKFDFVAMGRKLLADPELPNKLIAGRPDNVRPCIYCYACVSQIYFSRNVKCAVNPETAFERERGIVPAASSKKIVVIGGGPGGMEAARRLTLKGHKVTLIEQSDRLGGTVQFASIAYPPNERILNWLKGQVEQLPIDVRLKTKATPELLKTLNPDEIVVATGAIRTMPPIPGSDRANVFSGDELRRLVLGEDLSDLKAKTSLATRLAAKAGSLTGATRSPELIREATKAWMPLGDNIVIIGGELVGIELAEFLAERGRKVTVVDEAPKFGAGIYIVRRWRALADCRAHGVVMAPSARDIAIGDGEVTYTDADGWSQSVKADNVIVAKGAVGNLALADELKAVGFTVHTVGDCNGVGYIEGAIRAAAEVAVAI